MMFKLEMRGMDLASGASIPTGYGVAYMRPNAFVYVCYPIPLNVIVSLARRAWIALARFGLNDLTEQAYLAGLEKGRKDARRDQYEQGYRAGQTALTNDLREIMRGNK